MINKSEITNHNSSNVINGVFSERDKKRLFIKRFLNENFGEGKFYSKLKSYGASSFLCCEY